MSADESPPRGAQDRDGLRERLLGPLGRRLHRWVIALSTRGKRSVLMLCDLTAMHVSFALGLVLALERLPRAAELRGLWPDMLLMTVLAAGLLWALGLARIKLKAFDWKAIAGTALFAALIGLAGLAMDRLLGRSLPPSANVTAALLMFTLIVLGRVGMLQILLWVYRQPHQQRPVLIYGAGSTGMQLAAALATHDSIKTVGFIDDNRALRGQRVAGLPVSGPEDLPRLIATHSVERVLLALPNLPRGQLTLKLARLQAMGVDVHAVPSFAALAGDAQILAGIRPVSMDDVLGRDDLAECLPGAEAIFAGRSVLVTGAGGSIGAELCRQLLACRPRRLVLLDRSEPALYEVHRDLQRRARGTGIEVVARLGSVRSARLVRSLLAEHGVSAVLHAAAYKHVPLVEENPLAGLDNNVLGTRVLAECAREAGVAHFLLVSTDKAVRPRSMMGASKRLAELVVQDLATRAGITRFSMVRFGNVLGSSGSVFPLFREQIARGGPITLTHDEVSRYFMSIPEAARLVLTACGYARGGDLFVLDMGEPMPIRRLAEQMIEGAGLTVRSPENPHGDIEIVVTGLRPGEKLHEELLLGGDRVGTPHPRILRCTEAHLSEIEVATMLREIGQAVATGDAVAGRRAVLRWVGENAFDAGYAGEPAPAPAEAAGQGAALPRAAKPATAAPASRAPLPMGAAAPAPAPSAPAEAVGQEGVRTAAPRRPAAAKPAAAAVPHGPQPAVAGATVAAGFASAPQPAASAPLSTVRPGPARAGFAAAVGPAAFAGVGAADGEPA